jgi:hypothetical protein
VAWSLEIGYAALDRLVVACCETMLPARFFPMIVFSRE